MEADLETLKKNSEWNESYYFNFHDRKNELTALMRLGNKVNKNEKSMFFYLISPQLSLGMKSESFLDDQPLHMAGLSFQELESGKWRLKYKGSLFDQLKRKFKVKMDVNWQALNPIMDYRECVDERQVKLSSKVASLHYEQFGKAQGEIEIEAEKFQIEGLGERDFSQGVREWGSPRMWMWINSQFSSKEAFNITKLCVEEGEIDAGYFYNQESNQPLIRAEIKVEYDKNLPSKFSLLLEDKKGTTYPVEGEIIQLAMIPVDENMVLLETLSQYEWEGKLGYGVAEFLVPR